MLLSSNSAPRGWRGLAAVLPGASCHQSQLDWMRFLGNEELPSLWQLPAQCGKRGIFRFFSLVYNISSKHPSNADRLPQVWREPFPASSCLKAKAVVSSQGFGGVIMKHLLNLQ